MLLITGKKKPLFSPLFFEPNHVYHYIHFGPHAHALSEACLQPFKQDVYSSNTSPD